MNKEYVELINEFQSNISHAKNILDVTIKELYETKNKKDEINKKYEKAILNEEDKLEEKLFDKLQPLERKIERLQKKIATLKRNMSSQFQKPANELEEQLGRYLSDFKLKGTSEVYKLAQPIIEKYRQLAMQEIKEEIFSLHHQYSQDINYILDFVNGTLLDYLVDTTLSEEEQKEQSERKHNTKELYRQLQNELSLEYSNIRQRIIYSICPPEKLIQQAIVRIE